MAFVTDTFTVASDTSLTAHTSDSGGTWALMPGGGRGTPTVSASLGRVYGDNNFDLLRVTGAPASAEYDVEADMIVASTPSGGPYALICARMSTTAETLYEAGYDSGFGGWNIYKAQSGSYTVLNTGTGSVSSGQTKHLKFEVRNATKKLFVDGTQVCSTTDNSITAAGLAGIDLHTASSTTGLHLDNFTASDPSTGGAIAGNAALAPTGTIAAVGRVAVAGAASIPASGTLAAVATNSVPGAAVLSATGTVAASATNSVPAQAALLATGALAPVGRVAVTGIAALQGAGDVAAAGTVSGAGAQVAGSAALSATGTLAPAGRVAVAGIAALQGTGTIAPLGRVAVAGVAALAGAATLAATGQRAVTGLAALAGTGTLAAAGRRTVGASASLGASASVTAGGRLALAAVALLVATGGLTATGSGGTIVIGHQRLEAVVLLAGGVVAAVRGQGVTAPAVAPRWTEQQPAVGGYGILTPSVAGG